jgi:hypothetical protein
MHSARRKRRNPNRSDVASRRVEIDERDRSQLLRELLDVVPVFAQAQGEWCSHGAG